jgi:predicted ATPase
MSGEKRIFRVRTGNADTLQTPILSFSSFQLDTAEERLSRAGIEVRLRRKPFAVLCHLARNARRVVTHDEIVEAIWGQVAMSESLLRSHVHEIRKAVGEGIIETIIGRGYRFMVDVREIERPTPTVHTPETHLIERDPDLDVLRMALKSTLEGRPRLVFITGEVGIGKTTLVSSFLALASLARSVWTASASCSMGDGEAEPFLPLYEALRDLCRGPDGERVCDTLTHHAPTWLAQMPAHVRDDRAEGLQRRIDGATQARKLLELTDALAALSHDRPVVLALDDLQWSDSSTVEALAMIARHREPMRVLVIGALRPAELAKTHPLRGVLAELVAHKQATPLSLDGFSEERVAEYLSIRFPDHSFPRELAQTIHRMTLGNPLFWVTLVDDLVDRQTIRVINGRWQLATSVEYIATCRLESIRPLLEAQLDRLGAAEQSVLEAASVAGEAFTTGVVAQALGFPIDEVDACCESVATSHRFLRFRGIATGPDGSVESRYEFAHAFYRDAALARASSAARRRIHHRIAEWLEASQSGNVDAIAGELAAHFDEGGAYSKAASYYAIAAEYAARRGARQEARASLERARVLLTQLPEGDEREQLEQRIQSATSGKKP